MATGDGTPRSYTISTEITSGLLNSDLLTQEIEDDVGITTALTRIDSSGDDLDIYFVSALSGAEITALDALVLAHSGVVTLDMFQRNEENTTSTDTLESFVTKNSLTMSPVRKGLYRIMWSCETQMQTGGIGDFVQIRVRIDTNNKALSFWNEADWHLHSGFDFIKFKEGETPNVELQFRKQGGGADTAEIRRAKLTVEKVIDD